MMDGKRSKGGMKNKERAGKSSGLRYDKGRQEKEEIYTPVRQHCSEAAMSPHDRRHIMVKPYILIDKIKRARYMNVHILSYFRALS